MLRQLIDRLTGNEGTDNTAALEEDELRLAAAALLLNAARIDGHQAPEETQKLTELLARRFCLSPAETDELVGQAGAAEREAVDLYRFTSVVTRQLDQDGRKQIVAMLWGVVLADGRIDEFEDNLVWRVAELLGVSTRDRIRLKKQVQGDIAQGGGGKSERGA